MLIRTFFFLLIWAACAACQTIETRIEIAAPAPAVWAVFTDFRAYPDWNPFVRRLDGAATVGETIEVEIEPPGSKAMVFRPVVTERIEGRVLEWVGNFLMPGIFTGRHRFEILELSPGRTLFKHSENFSGALVPFFNLDATRSGFESMNRQLKTRAEQSR